MIIANKTDGSKFAGGLTNSETDMPVIFFDELPILINRMLKGQEYKIIPDPRHGAQPHT